MARMSEADIAAGYRAADRARAALKHGDRIRVTRCGGGAPTFTFVCFDDRTNACVNEGKPPFWMISASGHNDLSPASVIAVNGVPTSFRDDPAAHLADPFGI
jgi:hypothetical protein